VLRIEEQNGIDHLAQRFIRLELAQAPTPAAHGFVGIAAADRVHQLVERDGDLEQPAHAGDTMVLS